MICQLILHSVKSYIVLEIYLQIVFFEVFKLIFSLLPEII